MKKSPNYNEKIKVIKSYFKISEQAAKYMFHRRRRGYPWKKDNDVGYFMWSIQLQNALVKADTIALFNWEILKFDNDVHTLSEHGIVLDEQPNTIQVNVNAINTDIKEDDDEGWTVVTTKKSHVIKKQLLRNMGFLPQIKKPFVKYNKPRFENKESITEYNTKID